MYTKIWISIQQFTEEPNGKLKYMVTSIEYAISKIDLH